MVWREVLHSTTYRFLHEESGDYIDIEAYTNGFLENEKCEGCGKDDTECTCCEIVVFNDKYGDVDSITITKNTKEAMKVVKQLIKENPNGYFERPVEKKPFIFR